MVSGKEGAEEYFLSVASFGISLQVPFAFDEQRYSGHARLRRADHCRGNSRFEAFAKLLVRSTDVELFRASFQGLLDPFPSLQSIREQHIILKNLPHPSAFVSGQVNRSAPLVRLVNDAINPVIQIAPGEMQLWRIANLGKNGK